MGWPPVSLSRFNSRKLWTVKDGIFPDEVSLMAMMQFWLPEPLWLRRPDSRLHKDFELLDRLYMTSIPSPSPFPCHIERVNRQLGRCGLPHKGRRMIFPSSSGIRSVCLLNGVKNLDALGDLLVKAAPVEDFSASGVIFVW